MKFSQITGIRAGRRPEVNDSLSGVVLVQSKLGRGHAFIRFKQELVKRVGKYLPQGCGPENPAYLKAIQAGKRWRIFAMYIGRTRGVLLAEFTGKPQWLQERKE